MATVEQAPPRTVNDQALRPLLRRARRTWRRAGVLAGDRGRLSDELHAELVAAADAGQQPSTVLGDDPTTTLRQWAHEQQASGRALRIGLLTPLTLVSVLVGSAVIITDQTVQTVVPGAPFITSTAIWLAVVINSTIVSWLLAPLACWAALHRGGDPRAASTARWLFALLPVGAITALVLDIIIATISDTEGPFIQVMAITTAAAFAATPVLARHLATRYTIRRQTR
ncbi:hypothetical protein ACFFOM_18050 [Microlunatus capsulatus]|uniref:DUF1129 domain-containing protein n=1 Tax=Microlunatus capsulatus TaxID=99117 RepID=A0ABS4ZD19_9ACTN|nr:hypothetical protein [Microlunatus capsulatus]MBP2418909.1 hypothetical protein [Microlunatus capsulatus]